VDAGKRYGKKVNKKARQGESSGEREAEDEINACGLHEFTFVNVHARVALLQSLA